MKNDARILLIIGGGIAAYKSLELIRRITDRGWSVHTVITRSGREFVTPMSVSVLSSERTHTDLFDLEDEAEIGHIQLSREADLIVVAPATADLMAKMANGLADDLASTVLLATDKPVLAAPAMNVRMWEHPATRRNLDLLKRDGVGFVGPNEGDMACGEWGPGRMAEPSEILSAITSRLALGENRPLAGKHILVTAGPTYEPIDPVRYIANRSSGKQGYAIARAVASLGAETRLISGPTGLPNPAGIETIRIESAEEMLSAVGNCLPVDAAILTAAVADWKTANAAPQKMKKTAGESKMSLDLVKNPDILATLSKPGARRPCLVVGFAAETENVLENARAKLRVKQCDWIVANDVSPNSGTMGGDRNRVHLVTENAVESWPEMAKDDVADALALRISKALAEAKSTA